MVLNCPVELQISLLGRPLTLNTNDSTIARLVDGNYSAHLSTTSVLKDMKLKGMAVENSSTGQMMFSSHNDHHLHPRQKHQQSLIITQQETAYPFARMQEAEYTKSQGTRRASCSRLRSEEEMVEQSNNFHTRVILLKEKGLNRSRARSKSEIVGQLSNSFPRIKESGSRSFGGEYTERQTLKDPQGQGEKKVMKQQFQRQQMQKLHEKQTLHKPVTTRGGVGRTSISEPLWNL
jgi:hypothetical protein